MAPELHEAMKVILAIISAGVIFFSCLAHIDGVKLKVNVWFILLAVVLLHNILYFGGWY